MTPAFCPDCNHHFTPKNDQTQPGCYITNVNGSHRGATVTPIDMCNVAPSTRHSECSRNFG